MFYKLLVDFNACETEAINQHLDTVGSAINNEIEGSINIVLGGSSRKHTYIDGLSDTDTLVCLKDPSLEAKSPREVINYFADLLRSRLPRTEIKIGDLSVTVKFSDGHEIQLLPACLSNASHSGVVSWRAGSHL